MTAYYEDQLGKTISIKDTPRKIISLVPSLTELIFYIGSGNNIIGITDYCNKPEDKVRGIIKVGGTKKLNIQKIIELKPDIIFASKEENDKGQISLLETHLPIWVTDVVSINTCLDMITSIGKILKKEKESASLVESVIANLPVVRNKFKGRVAYLVWDNPLMVATANNYINDWLTYLGFINIFGHLQSYPKISQDEITSLNPDIIMLPSEPYKFAHNHIYKFKKLYPNAKVMLMDGEMFSWYGLRTLLSIEYFRKLNIT